MVIWSRMMDGSMTRALFMQKPNTIPTRTLTT